MSAAIIFSGQARTFDKCWPNIRWMVLRRYGPDVQVVASIDPDGDAHKVEAARADYRDVQIEHVTDPGDLYEYGEELTRHGPFHPSVKPRIVLLQLWRLQRSWEFAKDMLRLDCDTVIRCRCDIFFHQFIKPHLTHGASQCYTPWWGKWGGVNDRFAVMTPKAARVYFNTYSQIPRLLEAGCPLHPESLVKEALERGYVHSRPTMLASFSTMRGNMQRLPEVTSEDLAEFLAQ